MIRCIHMAAVPIERLQVCGGIAQPNKKVSQQMIACSKEKVSAQILISKLLPLVKN